ncbi:MAG: maleylpyruvate isomerase N-terminal domain-containing protein [Chloroflexota bacterium]
MPDREQIIQLLDKGRDEMHAVAEQLDLDLEVYPGWTKKHLIAHLAGWYDAVLASLQAHVDGEVPATPAARGEDLYNAQTVSERVALSYEQVAAEWEIDRAQLKELVRQMPEEKYRQQMVFPWGETGDVEKLVRDFASHEIFHARDVRKRHLDQES